DPRFVTNRDRLRHRPELLAIIEPLLAALPAQTLVDRLLAADVPAALVHDLPAVRRDPQVIARGLFGTLRSGPDEVPPVAGAIVIVVVRPTSRGAPPVLDQDGRVVVSDLGLDTSQMAAARGG